MLDTRCWMLDPPTHSAPWDLLETVTRLMEFEGCGMQDAGGIEIAGFQSELLPRENEWIEHPA